MEVITSYPLDSFDFNSERGFPAPISCPSSASDSFSAPSSAYGAFTPTSGRSTPQKRHTLDSFCPSNIYFDMNPLPNYAAGNLSPEYKTDMSRVDYLGACVTESLPGRPSVETVPTTMGYPDYVEMSMPPSYSTSAPVESPMYEMYPSTYRGRAMDSSVAAASTVCMSDMCKSEPYDMNGPVMNRPPLSSMMAFSGGDGFRGSDSESVGSHSVFSPGTISSPELQHRLAVVNINERAGRSKRELGIPPSRGASMDQALISPSESDSKEHLGPIEIKRVSSGNYACTVPGCNKSFNRREHLKRHEKATHEEAQIKCPFCQEKQDKPFNRHDNFKHHIKMHASKRPHGRVEYHPDAVAYYEQLLRDTKPRSQRKGPPANRRPGPQRLRRDQVRSFAGLQATM